MYKVLIASAGLGTRLGDLGKNINKALVSVANKPVISHVIEKFPKNVEIVVAIGHKGELLKDYLNIAHGDRKFTFVEVEHYYGSKSGLGYTILQCEEHLQCPFVFTPNDTLILEDVPEPYENWMGYSEVENTDQYRSIAFDDKQVINKIYEKEDDLKGYPYIGLSGIKDYKLFWESMNKGVNKGSIIIGESYSLREMISNGTQISAKKFSWYDTGTIKNLQKARKFFERKNDPNILEKQNEAIWFVSNKVIKYHSDVKFISNRVRRVETLKNYVPDIVDHKENLYSYNKISGETVSKVASIPVFKNLLNYLTDFWQIKDLSKTQYKDFTKVCDKFYKEKTFKRVKLYLDKFSELDTSEIVNGVKMPPVLELLDSVPWDELSNGIPSRMHGDLHFENIIMSQTGNFCLIDWRQDFGGLNEYGDLYYDLAKLLHGLIVSHELINNDCYNVTQVADVVTYELHRKQSLIKNEKYFYDFLNSNNYDVKKVKILTALIFLNIAPLHHFPYCKMLFYLGKESLFDILKEQDDT
jgi:NDP-sugar pyrophosphorylase family protein